MPFARLEAPDGSHHRTVGIEAERPLRPSARFASASDGPFPNRATSTPLGMSAQRAAIPCASPSRRSASAFTTMVSTRRAISRQARRARGSSPVRLRLLANTSGTRASRAAIAPTSAGRHW